MKRISLVLPALLAALVLGACGILSTHPAAELAGSAPVPESWLGVWTVESILDKAPQRPTTVGIEANGDGSLQLTLHDGDRAVIKSASLAEVGGGWIASVVERDGSWTLLKLAVADGRMTVLALSPAAVKADIRSGLVAGEVRSLGGGEDLVRLTSPGAALLSYLQTRAAAFGVPIAVLSKVPDSGPES